jgi:hypothetical protein
MTIARPTRVFPDPADGQEAFQIWSDVRAAVQMLPSVWNTRVRISGVNAEDVPSFNTAVGTTIEREVVRCLNSDLRHVWDPSGVYADLRFERQGTVYPDAPLRRPGEKGRATGLELKGWYILSREGEPSFRYHTDPASCAPSDMLVVVPWILDEIVRGKPIVFEPYIEQARYAAETTQWYWQHGRKSSTATPGFKEVAETLVRTNAVALDDDGRNFSRLARCDIPEMTEWLKDTYAETFHDVPLGLLQVAFAKTRKTNVPVIRDGSWERLMALVPEGDRPNAQRTFESLRDAPEWDF